MHFQVEVEDPERYRFDGECLLKAEEMGHPGIVEIEQKQVRREEGAVARTSRGVTKGEQRVEHRRMQLSSLRGRGQA